MPDTKARKIADAACRMDEDHQTEDFDASPRALLVDRSGRIRISPLPDQALCTRRSDAQEAERVAQKPATHQSARSLLESSKQDGTYEIACLHEVAGGGDFAGSIPPT